MQGSHGKKTGKSFLLSRSCTGLAQTIAHQKKFNFMSQKIAQPPPTSQTNNGPSLMSQWEHRWNKQKHKHRAVNQSWLTLQKQRKQHGGSAILFKNWGGLVSILVPRVTRLFEKNMEYAVFAYVVMFML